MITKKGVLLIVILCFLLQAKAQLTDNLKLGIEAGFIGFSDSEKLCFLFNLEPAIRSSENSFIGLRFAVAVNSQTFENQEGAAYVIDNQADHGFLSIIPTFDYHWEKERIRPFLGIGLGPYLLANSFDLQATTPGKPSEEITEVSSNIKLGLMLRSGFEINKLRFGIEYNFIPSVDIKTLEDELVGSARSSYLGVTIGYVFRRQL